jgi:hypothetical protein
MYYQRLDGQTFHESSTLFGLQNGRICEFERVLHDARWYNRYGEKLGWGDLVPEDFERIASGLKSDELFIILRKVDMYRDSYVRAGSDEDHPPLEYLLRESVSSSSGQKKFLKSQTVNRKELCKKFMESIL